MTKELNTENKQKVVSRPDEPDQNIATPSTSLPERPLLFNPFLNTGFFSFRYSYREMSSSKGKTHVRGQEYRYEDGKLSSEQFEGTTDGIVHDQAVQNMRNLVADSMGFFFKSFASLLPSTSAKKDRD